jgi:hypothetical protein
MLPNLFVYLNREFVSEGDILHSQVLEFHVFDSDSNSRKLADQDFLGSAQTASGEIVSAPNCNLTRPLRITQGQGSGSISIRSEEVSNNKDVVRFQMRGNKLDQKDLFGKSDPFLNIYRCNKDSSFTLGGFQDKVGIAPPSYFYTQLSASRLISWIGTIQPQRAALTFSPLHYFN